MAITKDEVISLMDNFHDVVMLRKGTAAEQAAFFLYPDEARIFIPHGEDVSVQANYEIHQKLTDEAHTPLEPWDITPLSSEPERARAVGAVYWEGRLARILHQAVGSDRCKARAGAGCVVVR